MTNNVSRDLIKFRAEPEIRLALKLRAAYDDGNITTVILDALRTHLADQIQEVRQRMTSSSNSLETDKPPRRRKP
jgi:hypothetical protein